MPSISSVSQFFIALIAGGEADQAGHADIERVVVLDDTPCRATHGRSAPSVAAPARSPRSCAPAQPAPQSRVTCVPAFSSRRQPLQDRHRSAASPAARARARPATSRRSGFSATSPGITTTATPRCATATRIARVQDLRQLAGIGDQLDIVAAFLEQAFGMRRLEIVDADLACSGYARRSRAPGTPLRWQSNRPLIRCRLPGPQLPAQTASLPVRCASAPAAKAAPSSCRMWIHSMRFDAPQGIGEAVERIADDAIDPLHARPALASRP